jgi:uncharacterized membrane protein YoaK (UPF0700 family)
MLKAVLHSRALCAAFAATALACFALGVLAAAVVARWAGRLAPVEPAADDPLPTTLTPVVGISPASPDAGIHEQASSRYAGGIMQDAVNG